MTDKRGALLAQIVTVVRTAVEAWLEFSHNERLAEDQEFAISAASAAAKGAGLAFPSLADRAGAATVVLSCYEEITGCSSFGEIRLPGGGTISERQMLLNIAATLTATVFQTAPGRIAHRISEVGNELIQHCKTKEELLAGALALDTALRRAVNTVLAGNMLTELPVREIDLKAMTQSPEARIAAMHVLLPELDTIDESCANELKLLLIHVNTLLKEHEERAKHNG